jgi:hypothetical protein
MARLFITPREIDFINDLNKELVKDVVGQTIVLYPISEIKTKVHDVYQEAVNKIFEKPIRIDALVEWEPEDVRTNQFGTEEFTSVTAFIPHRDMINKDIRLAEGDFFSYGPQFFEVTSARTTHNIYGQIEFTGGMKLTGKEARRSLFISKLKGPTDENYSDSDAIQDPFHQQRGFDQNAEGPTGDVRDLQRRGVLDAPLTGPSEVSSLGTLTGSANSSFYDDQD